MRLADIEVTGQHRRYVRATPDPCAGVPALPAARLPSVSQGVSVEPDHAIADMARQLIPAIHRQAPPPGWQLCSQRVLPRHAAGKELATAPAPAAAGRPGASFVSAARTGNLARPGQAACASRRCQPLHHPSDAPVFCRPDNGSSSGQLVGRYGTPRPYAHDLDTAPGPRPSIGRAKRHSVAERQGRHGSRARIAGSRHARRTICPLPSSPSRQAKGHEPRGNSATAPHGRLHCLGIPDAALHAAGTIISC